MKSENKKAIGIMLAVIMAVSVFIAAIPGIASEPSNTPATTEQTEEMGIEELQQRIYEQGYNYTVAENRITRLSSEERKALCGYKHLKAPTEPLPENVRFVSDVPKVKTEKIGLLPSSYDAMALGYVTPVKNQGACGSCWLQGAIADFESDVLINESQYSNLTLDFSEQEVGDCNIWASLGGHNFCEGGNAFMTTNYFTKYGTADEACQPYAATPQTCQNCPILKNVDNWRIITGSDGESQISTIKNAIQNYGPVYSTIYASDSAFSAYDSGVYEYWGSESTNHAIEIIGWDDSLEAWLIKNSWGTDWGRNSTYPGCGWVAYGAANLGDGTNAISSYKNPSDVIFYHDECGWMTGCVGCGTPTAYGAVRFIPSQDSTLTAVDFWAVDASMAYEIKIFDTLNTVGSEYTFSNQLGTTQTGTINELGYYSIPLNTPVQLVSGDDFIVQVKLTTTGYKYPIPVDYCGDPDLNWAAIATFSGESYWSGDGTEFEKLYISGIGNLDTGIRARAEVEVAQPDIWVSPTEFNVTLPQNMVSNETLIIGNNGNWALTYSITDSESTNNPLSSECISLKKKYANIQSPGPELQVTAHAVSLARVNGHTQLAASTYGNGNVVVISDEETLIDSYINYADNRLMASNAFEWLAQGSAADCSWLDKNPKSGSVEPGNSDEITVSIDTTSLDPGDYSASITISNNDPDENPTIVPVNLTVESPGEVEYFDTGSGTYPSISGTHTGTIEPSYNVNVSKMYTYPCVGTGGHTEYVRIYGDVVDESKIWDGYTGDYHNITFDSPFTLEAGKTYNYEIRTGSYPQIIHATSKPVTGGIITCTKFVDANDKEYTNWIPAIRLE